MAEAAEAEAPTSRRIAVTRLALGLAQGVGLYLLSEAQTHKVWPADAPALYAALLLVLAFVPIILIAGLGRIRWLWLAVWAAAAAVVLAVFAWHDIDAGVWANGWHSPGSAPPARIDPAFEVFLFGAVFVFVGHHLVGPADEARRWIAPYPLYFDWAWKDGVQLALSGFFVGVLWLALFLGAELFKLIGIDALETLIQKGWFAYPVSGLAFAAAVQLTDVRIALIRGVRMVGLVLLSWLLPVMTVIVVAFLAALPFTGLTPLFGTKSAAATVLWASAVLILMTSAAYQDGQTPPPAAIRWAARAAGLALVPLAVIAAIALWLRVSQYGLSPPRVEAIASALVIAGFAGGYAFAALPLGRPWMKRLELTNVVMARAAMLVIILVFTPIADPARLAVDSQMSRLTSGQVAPGAFDFDLLMYRTGRYGADAMTALLSRKGDPRDVQIAQAALAAQQKADGVSPAAPPWWRTAHVYPAGQSLPASFVAQYPDHTPEAAPLDGTINVYDTCLEDATKPCDIYLADVDGSAAPQVLITLGVSSHGGTVLQVFKPDAAGAWQTLGTLRVDCADALAALQAGQGHLAPRDGSDFELAGRRQQLIVQSTPPCAQPKPAGPSAPR